MPSRGRAPAYVLGGLLAAAVAMFGGVYLWCAAALSVGIAVLGFGIRARPGGRTTLLDTSIAVALAGILLQVVPLPHAAVAALSSGRIAYEEATRLRPGMPPLLTLSIDPAATLHAFFAAFCTAATFVIARTVFSRGGIRTVVTGVAWTASALVLVSLAHAVSGTSLVYGLWRPEDGGARPLGPFFNRNHAGTWTVLALMLCFGHLQWRRASSALPPGAEWRVRAARTPTGRSIILTLAVAVLTGAVALGASRSTMLALASAAGYVALAAPREPGRRRGRLRMAVLALTVLLGAVAYTDVDRPLSRVDGTRRVGFAQRVATWTDTVKMIRDFPITGAGAGTFADAARLYRGADRSHSWNEAHNQYLQVAAEGGLLLLVPLALACFAFLRSARRALARRDDATLWIRIGAAAGLFGVAVQACFETGLSLPANGMLAAVAAAILVHEMRPDPVLEAPEPGRETPIPSRVR